ncbi:uncharacterized protein RHO25_002248 [Cercospora beticola]|uniref:Uncharacterized protein n=1 Tax=Cercospora beticola TaxID=122368 RepID=A0ABZ0NDM8_CERBT|nr:hypothetical protein RHO25_002248 [Cercospora beticola]
MFWRFLEPKKDHRITLHMCNFSPPTKAEKASVGVFGKLLRGKKKNGDDHEAEFKVEHKVDPHWQAVRALLPGGSGHLLSSLYTLEYPFLRTQQGDMMISPNAMPGRGLLMEKCYPLMEMLTEDTFASIEEAEGQFGWRAEM